MKKYNKSICQTQMTDREAMGLPNDFYESTFDNISPVFDKLMTVPKKELVAILENADSSLEERYASGQILALTGDPRLNPLSPTIIRIPETHFMMGTSEKEAKRVCDEYRDVGVELNWILKECPNHMVFVKAYDIGKYPVTNYEYFCYLNDVKGGDIPDTWHLGRYPHEKSNHPVYGLSIQSILTYIDWLNIKTQSNYRLPTEAEWELAARGPEALEFPWGNEFSSAMANTVESGIYQTTPVGIFPSGQSFYGILDMAGNVEEYCENDYYAYPGGFEQKDHLNEQGESYKVARGGSFARFSDLARCARRHGNFPLFKRDIFVMGFRLARSI